MKVATPLSTLIKNASEGDMKKILGLSDALEGREHIVSVESDLPHLYHCELSIIVPWDEHVFQEAVATIHRHEAILTSFHVLSCYVSPEIKEGRFYPNGEHMSEKEMLKNAENNIGRMRQMFPDMEILIENNNYFSTGAYETVTTPAFLAKLSKAIGVNLLLDIGHAEISAKHQGITLDQYVAALPLGKVRQIHLSGISRGGREYGDAHEVLTTEDWKNFERISAVCPTLEFVTIEYYKDASCLIEMLTKLKSYI